MSKLNDLYINIIINNKFMSSDNRLNLVQAEFKLTQHQMDKYDGLLS